MRAKRGELGCFGDYWPEQPCLDCNLASWCSDLAMQVDGYWDARDREDWMRDCEHMEQSLHKAEGEQWLTLQ